MSFDSGSDGYCMIVVTDIATENAGYRKAIIGQRLRARRPTEEELDHFYDKVENRLRKLSKKEREGVCAVNAQDYISALEARDPECAAWFRDLTHPWPTVFVFFADEFVAD